MDKFIEIDGLKTRYREQGSGAHCLLVMHGWGCTLDTVESISRVAAESCRVISIDLPGFGQTQEPPAIWGVEEYTRFITRFVERMGLTDLSLLGHSFGGRIGILYASRHPEVRKLILVDAAGVKPRRSLSYYIKVYSFKGAKRLALLTLPRKRAERLIDRMRASRGSADYSSSTAVMRGILSKCVNEDLCHVMGDIKAPTLLIWGSADTATPLRDSRTMERLIPDAGLVSFDGCGHYSFLDNPRQFAAVLRSFLNS